MSSMNQKAEKGAPKKPANFRKPNQKPFNRDGARYVCTACGERYFTKEEVESHFFQHPEDSSNVA